MNNVESNGILRGFSTILLFFNEDKGRNAYRDNEVKSMHTGHTGILKFNCQMPDAIVVCAIWESSEWALGSQSVMIQH